MVAKLPAGLLCYTRLTTRSPKWQRAMELKPDDDTSAHWKKRSAARETPSIKKARQSFSLKYMAKPSELAREVF